MFHLTELNSESLKVHHVLQSFKITETATHEAYHCCLSMPFSGFLYS
uniref:Uncharacterized protein n=1 Tax=Arundo donax TaxID=35708 RepID=A0A0A9H4F5_ARUDO